MKKNFDKEGFTIIEVVLVLAIAGLILMLALVAYPALQRSQRDTERKNMVSTVASAVNSYASNNRGALPASDTQLIPYVPEVTDAEFAVTVTLLSSNPQTVIGEYDSIMVYTKARCGATTPNILTQGSSRQFVVVTAVEAGSNSTNKVYFCQNG